MTPDADIARAFETTWPAAEYHDDGAFRTGRGLGGGGRISSTRALSSDWRADDISAVEAVHEGWGQRPMFRVPDTDAALSDALVQRGYLAGSPTAIMAIECAALAEPVPPLTMFDIWPPLAIQREIWAAGNISPPRQAAMDRVAVRRTAILGRVQDRAAGSGFIAVDGPVGMIHAIEVAPEFRRRGIAGLIMRFGAQWAASQGATRLALAVTRTNSGARAAYDGMGFAEMGGYSYWTRD